jgi:hypothetical protein
MSRERYRQNAAECLALAQQVTDAGQKDRLLQMAQAWNDLADRAEGEKKDDRQK